MLSDLLLLETFSTLSNLVPYHGQDTDIQQLCHRHSTVMALTFNGYVTDLTLLGRCHNR